MAGPTPSQLGSTSTANGTEKHIVSVQSGTRPDIDKAVAAAARAALKAPAWKNLYYAGFADKVFGQVVETGPDKFAYTVRESLEVCGQIIP
ncbi:hypothetical protein PG985_011880 [Apiospora marii]|uniref:uncharacterized protein n=1 Tax=Apiospora marii TaxID=335849 RepID=UPI00312D9B7F